MKQKLLSALLMSAFAGVATNASAGVIQASYKNFAAEAFGADIAMTAPVIGYSLALPLTGTLVNPNSFTVTYTLTSGEWDAANQPSATLVSVNNTDYIAGAPGVIDATDKRKISFAFTLNNGVTFPTNSTIVLGSNAANGAAVDGKILKVFTTLQTPALPANYCTPTTAEIGVNVKLTNAANVEFDSNFTLAPLKNDTPILQSGVATKTTVTSGASIGTGVANNEASTVDVLVGSLSKFFSAVVGAGADVTDAQLTANAGVNNRVVNLGQITFGDRAALYDIDGGTVYSTADGNWVDDANGDGGVSQDGFLVKLTGVFAENGLVKLSSLANCDAAGDLLNSTAGDFNAARTELNLSISKAQLGTNRKVNVCYVVDGTKVIPTAQFAVASGTLKRGTVSKELATPICPANLYNLQANGVRVDVRNYIPAIVEAPSGGWKNVVRVINTDEVQTVDVYGTALLRNGDIGATAVIAAAMKPREVRYLSSLEIDGKLNAAATATAKTFGADDIPANARLRITAASSSIRVQNYHFNPATGNYLEASAAQGDEGPDYPKARDRDNK